MEESGDSEGTAKAPAKRSLLGKIWWQAKEHFGPDLSEAANDSSKGHHPDTLRRLPADFAIPAAPASAKWKAPEEGRKESEIEFSWVGESARHVGTVVHRWLQRIADDELRGWDEKRVDLLKKRFSDELRRRGVQASEAQRSGELVAAALKNALTDKRGRWILGPHPIARTEHRIRTRARNFRIDRTFQDDRGTRWVVDYKTSEHEGADIEAFLDEQRNRYALQLDAYSEAMDGARRGLYFPLLTGWREW